MHSNKQDVLPKYTISKMQKICLDKAVHAHSTGNLSVAESEYRKLIAEKVKIPSIYTQLSIICAMSNRIEEAKQLCYYVLKMAPKFVNALITLADIFKNERRFSEAIDYYQQVIFEAPTFAMAHFNLSYSLIQMGKIEQGKASCMKALEIAPDLVQAKDYLGQILIIKGELIQAEAVYNELIAANPKNISALYSLGNIYKSQGKLESASSIYQKVITIQPEYSQAHFTYASIHKYLDQTDPHIALMLQQYQKSNISIESKIHFSFALAKAFEDIKDYKQAFKYLSNGNRLRFERFNYSIEPDAQFIKNIINKFSRENIEGLNIEAQSSKKPIFIVGMPRSGTSLVEKIIATHSQVHGAGELDYLFRLGTTQFLNQSTNFLFNDLSSYDKQKFEVVGQTYLKQINQLNDEQNHITDKFPFNMLFIGLIKIAFPNAKIIHCVREAKDNCLSIFKKNFTTDNYRFAYNLKTLGQYHKLYQELMKHWHETFPDSIYDISYESLTANPDIEIKKLIKTCDLAWEDDCLNFDKSKAIVKTASAYQVRQPMYISSVGLWEHYQEFLEPLISELNAK